MPFLNQHGPIFWPQKGQNIEFLKQNFPPFCISIVKVFYTQIFCHSLDFNIFYIIQEYFNQSLKFLPIKEGGPNFWGEAILQKVWIISSPILYFNLKSFMDPTSLSVIRFQWILHDSGVLFSESCNFYKLKRGDLIVGGKQFCRKSELFGPPYFISI